MEDIAEKVEQKTKESENTKRMVKRKKKKTIELI